MKKCSRCHETKTLDQFHKRTASRDGLGSQCRPCHAISRRAWTLANPEKVAAVTRKWQKANPEKVVEFNRAWREANRGKRAAESRAYYKANPERHALMMRAWREANPEKVRENVLRRLARKMGNGVFAVTDKEVKAMLAKCCYLCEIVQSEHLDHIIPISRGGRHSVGNLAGACATCNRRKGRKLLIEYRQYLRRLTAVA